jgi:hypothetical protein
MDTFDPLEPTSAPRWLIVKNLHNAVVESSQITPGADLKRSFLVAMLKWIDAGWKLGEFSSRTGQFIVTQGTDRRTVSVSSLPPGPRGRMR